MKVVGAVIKLRISI